MKQVYRTFEVKEGKEWKETYRTEDRAKVYEDLACCLMYSKVFKSPLYKRMTDRPNYDGTRTIIFYQDNGRSVFVVEM